MSLRTIARPSLALLALFTLLTGVLYPAAVTALAGAMFPEAAGGSLVRAGGRVVGSSLVAQPFHDPRYFWGRPSAAVALPDGAAVSGGSNLAPASERLRVAVAARVAELRAADPAQRAPVPVDLVTASASGLDPHLSPAAAYWQVGRVARARGLPVAEVRALVDAAVEGRALGLLGEPRVEVLALNLALDAMDTRAAPPAAHSPGR